MKAVVFYELGDVTMDQVMEVYPRHQQVIDKIAKEGKIIAIGPFADPKEGSMGIFRDKVSAEDFIRQDPFVIENIVGKVTIKEWDDSLL